jgi:hypothetical protein
MASIGLQMAVYVLVVLKDAVLRGYDDLVPRGQKWGEIKKAQENK